MRKLLLAGVGKLALAMASGAAVAQSPSTTASENDPAETRTDVVTQEARVDADIRGETAIAASGILDNATTRAFGGATGMMAIQQNNGGANAINSVTTVAAINGGSIRQAAEVSGAIVAGTGPNPSVITRDDGPIRGNRATDAFEGAAGLVAIQQNNGNANTIGIANAIAHGSLDGDLTQDADFNGSIAAGGRGRLVDADVGGVDQANRLNGSFAGGFDGVATVQQNNGDGNVIGAANAIVGETGEPDTISQTASAGALLIGGAALAVDVFVVFSDLDNLIDGGSFNAADGLIAVQQNNGSANIIGAATAVAAASDPPNLAGTVTVSQHVVTGGDIRDFQLVDFVSRRNNRILGALDSFGGVATVQQNNGSANLMSAAIGLVTSTGRDPSATVAQTVSALGNIANSAGNPEDIFDSAAGRANRIGNALNDAGGVLNVQQNNGDANLLASGMGAVVTGGDAGADTFTQTVSTLGAVGTIDSALDNRFRAQSGERFNVIGDETGADRTVSDARLWATFQQNNGSGNAIFAPSAVAVHLSGPGEPAGQPADAAILQTISTSGVIGGVTAGVSAVGNEGATRDRANVIGGGSFADSEGAVTVQQNNGDANVLSAATGILAADGGEAGVAAQAVEAAGLIRNAGATEGATTGGIVDLSSNRDNAINGAAFSGYRGVFAVQHSNGSASVLSGAIGIVALRSPESTGVVTSALVDGAITDSVVTVGLAVPPPLPPTGPETPGLSSRNNAIDGAFDGAEGVGSVIQNNGDVTVIDSAIAVATHGGGPEGFGGAASSAVLGGIVSGNTVVVFSADADSAAFSNAVTDSFRQLTGVTTAIQNNGSASVIGSAVSVGARF